MILVATDTRLGHVKARLYSRLSFLFTSAKDTFNEAAIAPTIFRHQIRTPAPDSDGAKEEKGESTPGLELLSAIYGYVT